MAASKRIRRKVAYVEYFACAEEVKSLLAQGFSKLMIHERLTEEGRFSMAYVTFCQVMQKIANDETGNSKSTSPTNFSPSPTVNTPPVVTSPPKSHPRIANSAKEPFPDPRSMSLEDGI